MATKPRGLGPQGKSALDRYINTPDNTPGIPPLTLPEDKLSTTRIGNRSLFPSGSDFEPYLLDFSPTYFQGPSRSSRVQAHQFVPLDADLAEKVRTGSEDEFRELSKQFDASVRGHIYVKFWKRGDEYKYGPCSLTDYRTFRDSSSKGRSVVGLQGYGYERSTDSIFNGI